MTHATAHFWVPAHLALGRGQISLILITKSISIFLSQNLCVFSQIKDIKHIRRDFHSVPWVMPQGLGLGVLGVKKILNMVMWHIKLKGMSSRQGYTENFTLG